MQGARQRWTTQASSCNRSFSAEVFVNDGEQVMSITFKTDLNAEKISFVADGVVKVDILKYEIR